MNNKGFSLVELMVVIAIVALLAAIAVPSYRGYSARARMTEVYNLLQNQLDYVAQQYSQGGTTTRALGGTGLVTVSTGAAGQGIRAVPSSSGGTVVINFAASSSALSPAFNQAQTITNTYTASVSNDVLTWSCILESSAAITAANKATIGEFFPDCTNSIQ